MRNTCSWSWQGRRWLLSGSARPSRPTDKCPDEPSLIQRGRVVSITLAHTSLRICVRPSVRRSWPSLSPATRNADRPIRWRIFIHPVSGRSPTTGHVRMTRRVRLAGIESPYLTAVARTGTIREAQHGRSEALCPTDYSSASHRQEPSAVGEHKSSQEREVSCPRTERDRVIDFLDEKSRRLRDTSNFAGTRTNNAATI